MSRLRVGVIGLGVGEQHLRGFLEQPDCQVVRLCDFSPEKRQEIRSRYPDLEIVETDQAILGDPQIDVVAIASYDNDHYAQVIQALDAGKHVFVEKPLCQTLEQLKAIKRAFERQGGKKKLGANLVLRTAPAYQELKARITQGELGTLYAIDGDYLYGRIHKFVDGWRGKIPDYTAMQGGGIHLIDLMVWLTGFKPEKAFSVSNAICSQGAKVTSDDYIATTLWNPRGPIGRVTAHLGCVHRHQHVVRLFGTKATFLYDDTGARLHSSRDPNEKPLTISANPLPPSKKELIAPFVESILKDKDVSRDVQSYCDAMSIVVASDRAMKTQATVDIEYV